LLGVLLHLMTQLELLNQLEIEVRKQLEIVRANFSEKALNGLQSRSEAGVWNALECFAHLNFFFDRYLPRIERAIHLSKARRWGPGDHVRYTWMGRRINKFANIANLAVRKTSKKHDFFDKFLGKETIKTFIINSERLLRNIQAAREVDLNHAKIGWGPSGFFSITLGNTLEWLVLHGQRHVNQALKQ
jgi:DinB superfamily